MPTILIVDDEPEMVRGLSDNLRFEGYRTLAAANGEDGLRLALQEVPDLILLDAMMPRMSGWDVCRQLRQRGVDVPVIMLTARGEEVDRVRSESSWPACARSCVAPVPGRSLRSSPSATFGYISAAGKFSERAERSG